jgi:hypothetical protein
MTRRARVGLGIVSAGILGAILGALHWTGFIPLQFVPLAPQAAAQTLTPLFLVATFVERAVEVFVTSWRGKESSQLEAVRNAAPTELRPAADQTLLAYKTDTQRIAFKTGSAMGLILAIAGVRILSPFIAPDAWTKATAAQYDLFVAVDVMLTAVVIGGGADGMHQLVSVITDFLGETRRQISS